MRRLAMKKFLLLSLIFLLLAGSTFSQIPTPVPGWPYRSGSNYILSRNVLGRFSDEGIEKHLYFSTFGGEVQKFNLGGLYAPGWPLYCDTLLFGSDPIILDIDNDGQAEIASAGARRESTGVYSLLFLINDNGTVMPGFPIRTLSPYGLAAADMDDDGEYEIFYFSAREGIINCLDRYGSTKPGWPIPLPYDCSAGIGGSIGDLDLDGTNELVTAGYRNIYAFGHDGTTMEGFPVTLADSNFIFINGNESNVLADFDQDSFLEIIIGGHNWLYEWPPYESCFVAIYEHTGQPKPGWPRYFPEIIVSPITPSDIDNNGTIELGFQGYYLHFIGIDGAELPGWPVELLRPDGATWGTYSDMSIVDIDGDANCEIFLDFNAFYADSLGSDSLYYYGYSYLFATDNMGQYLTGYPIKVEGAHLGKPPVFSLDRTNSRLYMSLATDITAPWVPLDTSYLELYLFPDSTGLPTEWPMLGHDNLHTRNFNFVDRVTSINDGNMETLPRSPILKQNYPNPFNSSTVVEYSLPMASDVKLAVYDLAGRKVINFDMGYMEAGTHQKHLSMNHFSSGTYFYILQANSVRITRKMTLVK
jgi:hypothetical protein